MALKKLHVFLVGMTALLVSSGFSFQQGVREEKAVKWIARTLNRLGEPALANKFWKDFRSGKVRFVPSGDLEGDNAQVNWDSSGNTMELNDFALGIAEQEPLLAKNPYGDRSINLVILAATVVHEYVHMGQKKPKMTAAFEDPAWQYSDKNYARWFKRLRGQLEEAKKLPVSAERTAKVKEILNLLNRLGESAQGDAAELPGKTYLTKGQKWNLLSGLPGQILKTAKDGEAWLASQQKAAPDNSALIVPKTGAWVLVRSIRFEPAPNTDYAHMGFKYTLSDGSASASWYRGDDSAVRTSLKISWTQPPKIIEPGKQYSITYSPSNNGSSTGAAGFMNADTADYLITRLEDSWQYRGGVRPVYASLHEPMVVTKVTFTAPPGRAGLMYGLQVRTGSSLLGGWGYNYVYEFRLGK